MFNSQRLGRCQVSDIQSFDPSEIERVMKTAPVIPVLVVKDVGKAREQAEALVDGGLKVLEVTLRTPDALEAIKRMNLVPGAIVGAGTVVNPRQLEEARGAGSEFIVSPGLTQALGDAAISSGLPFLPGVANAGDIMRGLDMGLTHFKFFPAMASGGIPALKALSGPFGQCLFCPTGGITEDTAPDWLALKNVLCVGGSWIVPGGASVEEINKHARAAAALGG
jgi:2-dehydro-3-deoxyphosphogluconate aldolase / (4S)-4-hydroxy-2-oxoglutarate aldolase